jgi:hypothetical protein
VFRLTGSCGEKFVSSCISTQIVMETVNIWKQNAVFRETIFSAPSQVSNFCEECTTASFKLCTHRL